MCGMRNGLGKFVSAALGLVFCASFGIGPASAQAPDGCFPFPSSLPADYSQPPNLDLIKDQLVYYRCSQYDDEVAAKLAEAQQWVKQRAPQLIATGAKPAIVLDIDETSLSNWHEIFRNNFGYIGDGPCDPAQPNDACGVTAWEANAKAPALRPTLDLYRLARCIDVMPPCQQIDVFFITGRRVNVDQTSTTWTLKNLDDAGYKGLSPDHLYMRPVDSNGIVAPYKTLERTDIERPGFTIIANVGDQKSDLDGGHADRTFKVPNRFYYIPSGGWEGRRAAGASYCPFANSGRAASRASLSR